jgi:hypothetical protein
VVVPKAGAQRKEVIDKYFIRAAIQQFPMQFIELCIILYSRLDIGFLIRQNAEEAT